MGDGVAGLPVAAPLGFTAYLLYMMQLARGEHQTAHYAICTGFMSLGLLVPGAYSGKLQQAMGYPQFFLLVLAATIPSFLVATRIRIDEPSPMPFAPSGVTGEGDSISLDQRSARYRNGRLTSIR